MSSARLRSERVDALPALAEVFREYGFDGASLSVISKATKLGKGSLYHFFPGGKHEMMASVLVEIENWFDTAIFVPLIETADPKVAISAMFRNVDSYFQSGGRTCLVGRLGLGVSRDLFAEKLRSYFERWIASLALCLAKAGIADATARDRAEETVAGIQGSIVLSRALGDRNLFLRMVRSYERRLFIAVAEQNSSTHDQQ